MSITIERTPPRDDVEFVDAEGLARSEPDFEEEFGDFSYERIDITGGCNGCTCCTGSCEFASPDVVTDTPSAR
jgi:heterodisulfide reductase subunit C